MIIKRLRNFLQKNKVFIEYFSLIGIVGIIISYGSLKNQNRDSQINEYEHSPIIKVEEWEYEDSHGKRREVLRIINEGYRLSNFNSEIYTFIKIHVKDENLKTKDSILIPVEGYKGTGHSHKKNSTGELEIHLINREIFLKLRNAFYKKSLVKSDCIYEMEMIVLLEASYKDYKGDRIKKYFCEDWLNNGNEISEDEAMTMIKLYNKNNKPYLDEINPEYFEEVISKSNA